MDIVVENGDSTNNRLGLNQQNWRYFRNFSDGLPKQTWGFNTNNGVYDPW